VYPAIDRKRSSAVIWDHLQRLVREYPREPLVGAVREAVGAVREAAHYGLYDLDRLERMILRRVTREYFRLSEGPPEDDSRTGITAEESQSCGASWRFTRDSCAPPTT
jgi:hypothetical protein